MATAVSAPGKVLLSGGYLVVERAHTGLVLGLSARIHVVVGDAESSSSDGAATVAVRSPQFLDAEWEYRCCAGAGALSAGAGVDVVQSSPGASNAFVETALRYALSYTSRKSSAPLPSLAITIVADDDYYSHADSATACAAHPASRFRHFNVRLADAHKTGLGSSAALVTALTGALVLHILYAADSTCSTSASAASCAPPTLLTADQKRHIHNLAQAAHCRAQGKIGSGFDVGAAVYGSCIYRRFSPSVLEQIGEAGSGGFAARLERVVDDDSQQSAPIWDAEMDAAAVQMPRQLRLVMCDVDQGSSTPGMVNKVLAWRADNPAVADKIWTTLQQATYDLVRALAAVQGPEASHTQPVSNVLSTIRNNVRAMSRLADVPIEPAEQTELLDACEAQRGVVGGVAPGAGGYDALALLVLDDDDVLRNLGEFLTTWTADKRGARSARLLHGVRQDLRGLAVEDLLSYRGWL